MDLFGSFMFFAISAVHVGLGLFVLARMSLREAVPAEAQGPFIAVPERGTAVAASLNPETAWSELDSELVAERTHLLTILIWTFLTRQSLSHKFSIPCRPYQKLLLLKRWLNSIL